MRVALAGSKLPKTAQAKPDGAPLGSTQTLELAVRLFTVFFGLSAIIWGVESLPVSVQRAPIERVASYILDRDSFKPGTLIPLLPAVTATEQDAYCRPAALHSAAIIRLRIAENVLATAAREDIDAALHALEGSVRRSLACAAADPFLWTMLAWLDGTRNGFRPAQLQDLRFSYRLGPNEGWIAARRSRFALSIFGRLPPDLADSVTAEFARMVESWLHWDTLSIFTGPGWPIHDRLLAALKNVGERQREAFYTALYTQGYNVVVPGIAAREPRPWY